jgi:hypothetical protein
MVAAGTTGRCEATLPREVEVGLGVRGGPDPREGYGQRPSRRVGGTTSQRGSDGMYEYSGSSLGPSEGLWAMKMEDKMWRCRTLYIAGIGRWGVMTGPRVKPSAGTKQQRLCGRGYECEDGRWDMVQGVVYIYAWHDHHSQRVPHSPHAETTRPRQRQE